MAPTFWPTFEHVAFNEVLVYADFFKRPKDGDDEESVSTHIFEGGRAITYRGLREAVNIAPLRLRIARDFLEIRIPEHALAFAKKWGPFSVPDPRGDPRGTPMAFGALETLFESVVDERDQFAWIDELTAVLGQADAIRDVRNRLESADEAERSTSDNGLLEVIRTMGLAFEPGGSLDPQLVPGHIVQLTAVVLLEQARGIVRLQCKNWPSSGCKRDVPRRDGGRGRQPLYCTPECAARAQSAASYRRRRARRSKV